MKKAGQSEPDLRLEIRRLRTIDLNKVSGGDCYASTNDLCIDGTVNCAGSVAIIKPKQ